MPPARLQWHEVGMEYSSSRASAFGSLDHLTSFTLLTAGVNLRWICSSVRSLLIHGLNRARLEAVRSLAGVLLGATETSRAAND